MFCDKCGKEIPDGANFCRYCGSTVEADEIISESESTGDIKEPKVSEQTKVSESAADAEANVCDEDTADKADSEEDVDEDKTANVGDKVSAELKRKKERNSSILTVIIFVLVIGAIVIGAILIAKVGFTNQFKGTWSLMSGNYTCEDEENISSMPSSIEISGGGKVSVDGYSGEYDLDKDAGTITFSAGPYSYSYNYIVENDILCLLSYGSEDGTGDVGIYLNYADATDEHKEYYDYAVSAYSDIDLYDFLNGKWNDEENVCFPPEEFFEDKEDTRALMDYVSAHNFSLYKSDDGQYHISYNFSFPKQEDGFNIDGNLIYMGENLKALRIIPISDNEAYFYCYESFLLVKMVRNTGE